MTETTTKEIKTPTAAEEAQAAVTARIEEFLGEPLEVKTEEVKTEETSAIPKVEPVIESTETPKDEIKVEPVVETPKAEEPIKTPEIDYDKVKETVLEELKTKYNLTEKEAESAWIWEKENRKPATYEELAENIAEVAFKRMNDKMEAKATEDKIEADRVAKEQADKELAIEQDKVEKRKVIAETWDKQLTELQTTKKIANDAETTRDFYTQLQKANTVRKEAGDPPYLNLAEFYLMSYKAPSKSKAGADAPIAGSHTDIKTAQNEGTYSYDDIHNTRDLSDILHNR